MVVLWNLSIGFFHGFSDLLFVIIFLDEFLNCLSLSNDGLLLEVVASCRNVGYEARIVQVEETGPATNCEDVMVSLTVALRSKSVTVISHEFAILSVDSLEK